MTGFVLVLVVLVMANGATSQLVSPCPRLFRYEDPKPNEPDRIYGVLTLLSDADLNGIWLRVIFDKPSLQLGNWFGRVKTEDNTLYKIQAPDKKLPAKTPMYVRFYVKYDPTQPPPKLLEFRLNARTVCPEGDVTTEPPASTEQWFTSPPLAKPLPAEQAVPAANKPERPYRPPANNYRPSVVDTTQLDNFFQRPDSNSMGSEDEDFFMGDFSFLGKPRPHIPSLFEEQCGVVIKAAQPLITYGQPTSEGDFPWHAALYHARGIDLTYICGATLISRYHLVTVAHCVTRRKTQTALSPNSLMVYLGKFYLKVWSNPGIQDRQIEKIIVHQKYSSHSFANDIAVLKLNEPAEVTDYVRPVCLWKENANLESVIGRQGTVVGWGFDQTGRVTEQLTKAHMPVVSQETCIYSFPEFYSRFTSEHTYCAGFNNGKRPAQQSHEIKRDDYSSYYEFLDAFLQSRNLQSNRSNRTSTGTSVCNGDSGGGMVFPVTGSDADNPIWEIRGMVSISVALQNQFRCDSSHYVVFTDIAKYLDWIKNALTL